MLSFFFFFVVYVVATHHALEGTHQNAPPHPPGLEAAVEKKGELIYIDGPMKHILRPRLGPQKRGQLEKKNVNSVHANCFLNIY